MAPATLFPTTIRDYVHKNFLTVKRINNRNLLIIPDESKIQEAYKKGETTSHNNAFCAFKKQLCEYGFSVVARKDWLSLGLDLNSTWVYEHPTFTPENCEKCILQKPCKPITVRFQINPETGEIDWVNSGKTLMHGDKIINCVKRELLKNEVGGENKSVLARKRSLKTSSDEEENNSTLFLDVKRSQKRARKSLESTLSNSTSLSEKSQNLSDFDKSANSPLPKIIVQTPENKVVPSVTTVNSPQLQQNTPLLFPNVPIVQSSNQTSIFSNQTPILQQSSASNEQNINLQASLQNLTNSNFHHFLIPHSSNNNQPLSINPILQLIPMSSLHPLLQNNSTKPNEISSDDVVPKNE